MQHSDRCRKPVWPGTINVVPSFVATGTPTTHQCLHQELLTAFGSTTTHSWQSFKKPHVGRKTILLQQQEQQQIHWNNLHKTGCTKAKPAVARHNTHRVLQHNFSGKNMGCLIHLSQRSGPQHVSSLNDRQAEIINGSLSIIIFATLVTWFLSPLPNRLGGAGEH